MVRGVILLKKGTSPVDSAAPDNDSAGRQNRQSHDNHPPLRQSRNALPFLINNTFRSAITLIDSWVQLPTVISRQIRDAEAWPII